MTIIIKINPNTTSESNLLGYSIGLHEKMQEKPERVKISPERAFSER